MTNEAQESEHRAAVEEALPLMIRALALIDSAGEQLAAIYLDAAINQLAMGEKTAPQKGT